MAFQNVMIVPSAIASEPPRKAKRRMPRNAFITLPFTIVEFAQPPVSAHRAYQTASLTLHLRHEAIDLPRSSRYGQTEERLLKGGRPARLACGEPTYGSNRSSNVASGGTSRSMQNG
jgi:hypothetical protein